MRDAFFRTLIKLAAGNPKLMFLTADMGFGCSGDFAARFPDRFVNVGIAEQNMIGLATGLALSGHTVFVYSIANFPVLRCLEQIRNDVCHHDADVKIVSVGGGCCYGALGASHFAIEDLAVTRVLPGLTVVAPGDPAETEAAVEEMGVARGPYYLRLGRAGEPRVHETPPAFRIGRNIILRRGGDITLIATGGMLYNAWKAAESLAAKNIDVGLVSAHTLAPFDETSILDIAARSKIVVTVEEHSVIGGLGGAVAETLATKGPFPCVFRRFGLPREYPHVVGEQSFLLEHYGLSPGAIAVRAEKLLARAMSREMRTEAYE